MKNFLLSCLALLYFTSCKKDETDPIVPDPTPTYHSFTGQIGANDNSTLISADHNLLICGYTPSQICVLKISKTGTQLWRKDLDVGKFSEALGMAESSNQDIFICGFTSRNDITAPVDILLIKLNSSGDTIWTKTYGGSGVDYGYYIINTHDGNLLLCGISSNLNSGGYSDIYLAKLNTDGDTIWTRTYIQADDEMPNHVLQTQNDEYLVTGSTEDSISKTRQLYLLKVSADGTQLWNKKIGPPGDKYGSSTIELSNGDLMICGSESNQVLLVKTNDQGNIYWKKNYGESYSEAYGNSMKVNEDGTFIITGGTYQEHSGERGILLLKVAQEGEQLFLKDFGHTLIDYGQNVLKDENDDNIITGEYGGSIFMTKTDNNGVFK